VNEGEGEATNAFVRLEREEHNREVSKSRGAPSEDTLILTIDPTVERGDSRLGKGVLKRRKDESQQTWSQFRFLPGISSLVLTTLCPPEKRVTALLVLTRNSPTNRPEAAA